MYLRKIISICILCIYFNSSHQLPFIPEDLKPRFGDALEAIFGMGVRLQALLQGPGGNATENFLISPLSAALVVGQLMLGTEGEFQEQLYALMSLPKRPEDKNYILTTHPQNGKNTTHVFPYLKLHLQLGSLVRELKKTMNSKRLFTLESSNVLFVSKTLNLIPQFSHELELMYETEIASVNFKRAKQSMMLINKWASDHTNGLINSILQVPPGPRTGGIFANALYFLAEWEQPFSDELNTRGPFYVTREKPVEATFMTGFIEYIPYSESKVLNCKMVVLPYKNKELGMYMILPNNGHQHEFNIKRFAQESKITDILEMIENLKNKDVVVKIPKLSLSTSFSILDPLKKYASFKRSFPSREFKGMPFEDLQDKINEFENFNSTNTDDIVLTKAAVNRNLHISDILQQITFSINEKGTEAAAVTSSIMDYSGGSKSFLGNKPFMFFIRHEATAATLFWGTITNPDS